MARKICEAGLRDFAVLSLVVCDFFSLSLFFFFKLYRKVSQRYGHIYQFFIGVLSLFRSSQSAEESFCALSGFSLVICFIHSISSVYRPVPISQFTALSHLSTLVSVHLFSTSMSVFPVQISSYVPFFYLYVLIYDVFLSDLLCFEGAGSREHLECVPDGDGKDLLTGLFL